MGKSRRRYYTDKMLAAKAPPPLPRRDVRNKVYDYITHWDGDTDDALARWHTLKARERYLLSLRMAEPFHYEALRCILHAAHHTMPARNAGLSQIYSPRQLMSVIALRYWLGCAHHAVRVWLRGHEAERYLIFERCRLLPETHYLVNWEAKLTPADWERFLGVLGAVNPGTKEAIMSRISDGFEED